MKRFLGISLVLICGIAAVLFWPKHPLPAPVSQEAPAKSPRLLVHLLDYLAVDYGGAVDSGKVISDSEYKEQLEFIGTALQLSHELPELQSATEIQQGISGLSDLIQSKADEGVVAATARQLQSRIISRVGLPVSPSTWPSVAAAEPLFRDNCSKCHGAEGRGDGPSAATLPTKPLNFQDPEKMREMTPFQAFNTIRLGVPDTPMAAFTSFSDRDAWNLAFYVVSFRYRTQGLAGMDEKALTTLGTKLNVASDDLLRVVATGSDADIEKRFEGNPALTPSAIAGLRLYSPASSPLASLDLARARLEETRTHYDNSRFDEASRTALSAYIDGVEPVEPRIRASDPEAVLNLEQSMGLVRTAIHDRKSGLAVSQAITRAEGFLARATDLLSERKSSPALTFTLALGILLREGFEAALIIVALLGVIRVSGVKNAKRWVHAGWLVAVVLGIAAWIFSGWLTDWSGLQRELVEAITGVVTVGILLYLGFWLHSKTEIGKWKHFIEDQVRAALNQKNLFRLATIAFLAAFREAIETVLFLRAIWLEGGASSKPAMAGGVATAFVLILVLGWLLLAFSARIPIRMLFNISSLIMVALAVILTGKAVHAFQEVDVLSVTLSPFAFHSDWLGIYPTRETLVAQIVILGLSVFLWMYGKRPASAAARPATLAS